MELPTWFTCQQELGEGAYILSGYKNNFNLHGENSNAFTQNLQQDKKVKELVLFPIYI